MSTKIHFKKFVTFFSMFALIFSFMAPLTQPAAAQYEGNYCYVDLRKGGGVWPILQAGVAAGANVDCLDVVTVHQEACYLDMRVDDRVLMQTKNLADGSTGPLLSQQAKIWWQVGETFDRNGAWNTFPAIFQNGDGINGEIKIVVWITGLEEDYYFYANENPYPYPYPKGPHITGVAVESLGGGQIHKVSTICPPYEPPPVVQWCSPGYFKNNTTQWDASLQQMNYQTATGQVLTVKKKGVDVPYTGKNQSLLFVISNPTLFGDQTNIAADWVSSQIVPGYTARPTATDTYDCPLPGDGN